MCTIFTFKEQKQVFDFLISGFIFLCLVAFLTTPSCLVHTSIVFSTVSFVQEIIILRGLILCFKENKVRIITVWICRTNICMKNKQINCLDSSKMSIFGVEETNHFGWIDRTSLTFFFCCCCYLCLKSCKNWRTHV